jgi:hypothetical protein
LVSLVPDPSIIAICLTGTLEEAVRDALSVLVAPDAGISLVNIYPGEGVATR